jgi:hypothetical protein
MTLTPPPVDVLTRCTNRGSNPDLRILSPPLSPLKVLVPVAHPNRNSCPTTRTRPLNGWGRNFLPTSRGRLVNRLGSRVSHHGTRRTIGFQQNNIGAEP